jgi:large subunit ribosomal protein L11
MAEKKSIESLVNGGKATAGPPLGPLLGPLGLNVLAVVNEINEATKQYVGMKVPVRILVDSDTKEFEISVGIPTTSALIVSELGLEKGSGTAGTESIGDLSMKQAIKIVEIKQTTLLARDLKAGVKEILGSCLSMGVLVDGKDPKTVQKELDAGSYNNLFTVSV